MNKKYLLAYYFLLLSVEILAEVLFHFGGNTYLIYITKPLLMPTLMVWAFLFASTQNIQFIKLLIFALMFSLFGDISLMLLSINPKLFIVGLVNFLIAHIIYIILFIKIKPNQKSIVSKKPYLVLPVIIAGACLIWFLYQQNHPEFIKLQIPVIIYACVILSMLLAALSTYEKISSKSFNFLTTGALLFVLSDTVIALSKFSHLFEDKMYFARIIIMGLYGTAQFFIVKGYLLSQTNDSKPTNQ